MKSIARILVATLLSFVLAPSVRSADAPVPPAPDANTVHVVTYVEVAQASAPQGIAALQLYRDAVRGAAGNAGAELLQDLGRTYRFAITEQWRDRAAYDASRTAAAATQLTQALRAIQTAPPQTHLFRSLVTTVQKPPGPGRAKVAAISRFAIIPARAADFGEMASAVGIASRDEPGMMRYDVVQGLFPHQDKFAILEVWSSPDQYEAHRNAAHTKRFREQAAPLLDSSLEESFYGRFN
jgi:quinol monooxygenase YgiN